MNGPPELLRRTLSTETFKKSARSSEILSYLVRHLNEHKLGPVIWEEALGKKSKDYGLGDTIRQNIQQLKQALQDVFPPMSSGPRFELEQLSGKGWRVCYDSGVQRLTEVFWRPHLEEQREVLVVVNQPLFFRDAATGIVFRCFGVDPQRNFMPKDVLRLRRPDLFQKNPDLKQPYYLGEIETGLEAVQPYFLSGEISARDSIIKFISDRTGIAPNSAISGRIPDDTITRTSLILLGDSGINRFIDSLESGMVGSNSTPNIGWLQREDYLSYRLLKRSSSLPHGAVRIYRPSHREMALFPNGQLQAISSPQTEAVPVYLIENDPTKFIYGVVTRMVNPYNDASVTIISSQFSEAIEQMVRLLTVESVLNRFSTELNWTSGTLPFSFQGVFAVRLGTPSLDAGALIPQIVYWRDLTLDSASQDTEPLIEDSESPKP